MWLLVFSKDPGELSRKEKMSPEEITRSIRLALAAELDAINFYEQQSSLIPDGAFKKAHEDIAKEEITHFGEFMRLLYEHEPEEFGKMKEGWDEASGLLSTGDAPEGFGAIPRGDSKMGNNEGKMLPLQEFQVCRVSGQETEFPLLRMRREFFH